MVGNFRRSLSSCPGFDNLKHVFVASHGSSLDQYNSWGLSGDHANEDLWKLCCYMVKNLNIVEQTMHFSIASP